MFWGVNALRGLTAVAVNVVPAAGWFLDEWSAGTTLAVYWFENVAACLLIAIRIAVHRRLSPRRGHYRYQAPSTKRGSAQSGTFLGGFLVTSLVFSAAHGVFLGFILFMLNKKGDVLLAAIDWRSVGAGCLLVFVFLIVDLCADLPRLRSWPFLRIEQLANQGLGRVVVVHLTLIFGLLAVVLTDAPSALFGVFVVLKTLYALAQVLPQWNPETPPSWMSRLMNRLPNPGDTFEEQWTQGRAAEAQRRDGNEQLWTRKRQGREGFGRSVQR